MRKVEIPLIFSSDPDNGAINVSSGGDIFSVQLENPINIPADANDVVISMQEATVWNTIPNIVTGVNDLMKIVDDGSDPLSAGVATYNLVIEQGSYSLASLNEVIARELLDAGATASPDPLVSIEADDATQKVELNFHYVGISVDFTIATSVREILGFNSAVIGPFITSPKIVLADNVADFNQFNFLLIHSDLVHLGVGYNSTFSQVLDSVLVNVPPGSQIISTKFRPPRISEHRLAGTSRNYLTFWLTDDKNQAVNTNDFTWSLRLQIEYTMPNKMEGGRYRRY
jgi:hypothetical protein